MRPRGLIAATVVLLAACGPADDTAKPLTPEQSAALKPADPRIAGLYETSCKACHTVADAKAPLAGDRTQWDPRWATGEAALLNSVLQGKQAMPAGGQCFACTSDDYRALIRFMAGREEAR